MYDPDKAQRIIDFISELRHTKGKWAGKKWQWIDWQAELLQKLFGTVDDETGYRQYRRCYVEIPKKSGKSELAAAIALYLLVADDEYGAEVYSAACDRDQASIVFNVAASMVHQEPAFEKALKVLHSTKRIIYREKNSYYHVLSADAYSKHGYNIHGCIFDELHVQPNRDLWDVLNDGAGDARQQPLMFAITTAGVHDINSIGWEVHEYADKVARGIIEDKRFLPIIYSLPLEEDWEDEENWKKVNPSIGHTITLEKLRDAFIEAKEIPAKQNNFRRLRLNQWTSQETRWLDVAFWDACESNYRKEAFEIKTAKQYEELLKKYEIKHGRQCWAGLDLASSIDIAAFVMAFEEDVNGIVDILSFFWVPADNMETRNKKDGVPYDAWARDGHIAATQGNVIDYKAIESKIEKLGELYNIREIAYDRWGAVQISQDLDALGFTVVPFGQGFKDMSPAVKEFQKLVMGRKLRHDGNPVMRWMFDNIAVRTDPAENIKFDKSKATERIDGMVALAMAIDGVYRHQHERSVYEDRGILEIGDDEENTENTG